MTTTSSSSISLTTRTLNSRIRTGRPSLNLIKSVSRPDACPEAGGRLLLDQTAGPGHRREKRSDRQYGRPQATPLLQTPLPLQTPTFTTTSTIITGETLRARRNSERPSAAGTISSCSPTASRAAGSSGGNPDYTAAPTEAANLLDDQREDLCHRVRHGHQGKRHAQQHCHFRGNGEGLLCRQF